MGWYGIEFLVNLFEVFLFTEFIERKQKSMVSIYKRGIILLISSLMMLSINIIGEKYVLVAQFTFLFGFIIYIFISKSLMESTLKQKMMGIVQFLVIILLSDIITVLLFSIFTDVNISGIIAKSTERIVAMVLSKTITLYLIKLVSSIKSQDANESKTYILITYTGLFAINSTLSMTMMYLFKWSTGHAYSDLYVFLGSAGIIGVNFFIIIVTNYLVAAGKREKDNVRLQQQNYYYEKYIEDVEASRDAFHKLHHNYKHDIQCISGLTSQKAYDNLDEYVSSINKRLEETDFVDYSCPIPLNALLNAKKDIAERKSIDLDLSVFMPTETEIDDYDLCNIVGNILDNGIEACEKLADGNSLTLDIYIQKKMLIINGINAIETALVYDKNKIATTKLNKKFHGYGLNIIDDIANKYGGYSIISTENQEFNILVGMPFK